MTDSRDPPRPRPAASLILLRDGADGLEVLIGRRAAHIPAFPGVLSFPGGKIEAVDGALGSPADTLRAAAVAAVRETFEETGLLITDDGDGAPPDIDVAIARRDLEQARTSFADQLERWRRRPGLERLCAFSNWITPKDAPYRFDTWFFVAAASRIEAAAELDCCAEFVALSWMRPVDILATEAGALMRPTRGNLEILTRSRTAEEAIAKAQACEPFLGRPETIRLN
jgi:8-oxo-dGTP pyrophosphatase MutT (NUDIX family)